MTRMVKTQLIVFAIVGILAMITWASTMRACRGSPASPSTR